MVDRCDEPGNTPLASKEPNGAVMKTIAKLAADRDAAKAAFDNCPLTERAAVHYRLAAEASKAREAYETAVRAQAVAT